MPVKVTSQGTCFKFIVYSVKSNREGEENFCALAFKEKLIINVSILGKYLKVTNNLEMIGV